MPWEGFDNEKEEGGVRRIDSDNGTSFGMKKKVDPRVAKGRRPLIGGAGRPTDRSGPTPLSADAMLATPVDKKETGKGKNQESQVQSTDIKTSSVTTTVAPTSSKTQPTAVQGDLSQNPPDNVEIPPPDAALQGNISSNNETRVVSKLEDFQSKQKIIEEQNRRRKQMLCEAIQNRKRRTDQEARKLEHVQKELAKIDVMLTTDVRYLRDSIEEASLVFTEAQKRYDKAEKEFIAAKMHLFSAMERKEMLTDHLCAIIEQNELRKAKKLEELMTELSVDSDQIEESVAAFLSSSGGGIAELRTDGPIELRTTLKRPASVTGSSDVVADKASTPPTEPNGASPASKSDSADSADSNVSSTNAAAVAAKETSADNNGQAVAIANK